MANNVTTIQSLRAVDAWIDVINANINGGVRTAFKASRLRFGGTNVSLDRPATVATLPLQVPESSLITANTVIDFSQGAITSSTEETHLAIQGPGFFRLVDPAEINLATGYPLNTTSANQQGGDRLFIRALATARYDAGRILYTRDGEFHVWQSPDNPDRYFLRHASGLILLRQSRPGDAATWASANGCRAFTWATTDSGANEGNANSLEQALSLYVTHVDHLANATQPQKLLYSRYGSTVFQQEWTRRALNDTTVLPEQAIRGAFSLQANQPTVLRKSLEASNSSMTQSVPELSLAQKLFSALTKVLQINQTNQDSLLNTIR